MGPVLRGSGGTSCVTPPSISSRCVTRPCRQVRVPGERADRVCLRDMAPGLVRANGSCMTHVHTQLRGVWKSRGWEPCSQGERYRRARSLGMLCCPWGWPLTAASRSGAAAHPLRVAQKKAAEGPTRGWCITGVMGQSSVPHDPLPSRSYADHWGFEPGTANPAVNAGGTSRSRTLRRLASLLSSSTPTSVMAGVPKLENWVLG